MSPVVATRGRHSTVHTILVQAVLVFNSQVGLLVESGQDLRQSHGVVVRAASGARPHGPHGRVTLFYWASQRQ